MDEWGVGERKMKIYSFLPARNEESSIILSLTSLANQTLKPSKIILINDGSVDHTVEYAESMRRYGLNIEIINLPSHKNSYLVDDRYSWKLAEVVNHAFPVPEGYDYILQFSPDIFFPFNYIESVIKLMEENYDMVIAGGFLQGEPLSKFHVRGGGRIYKSWFWKKYIRFFPVNYTWESYPIFKAYSLGFKVGRASVPIYSVRPTKLFKAHYGYAMRELGYFPPFALARCLLSIFKGKVGVRMLFNYLRSPFSIYDYDVAKWIRRHQVKRTLNFKI